MEKNENLFHVAFKEFKRDSAKSTYLYTRMETAIKSIFNKEDYCKATIHDVKKSIEKIGIEKFVSQSPSGKNSYAVLEKFFEEYLE